MCAPSLLPPPARASRIMFALVLTVETSLVLRIDALCRRARAGASHSRFFHHQFIRSIFSPPPTSLSLASMGVCANRVTGFGACGQQCDS